MAGDTPTLTTQQPYWDEPHRDARCGRFPPAWRVEESDETPHHPLEDESTPTLLEVANGIVQHGDRIEHMEIPDLRALIEAVQSHPDARLAPKPALPGRIEIDPDHAAEQRRSSDDPPEETRIDVYGGEIVRCECIDLQIRCWVSVGSRFARPARFNRATFAVTADFGHDTIDGHTTFADKSVFDECTFMARSDFERARFHGSASFRSVHFRDKTEFENAHFRDVALFVKAVFANEGPFWGVRFDSKADFTETHFDGYVKFPNAIFMDYVTFSGARFLQNANFTRARFMSDARFGGDGGLKGTLIGGLIDFSHATIGRRLIFYDDVREEEAVFGAAGRLRLCKVVCMSGAAIELSPWQLSLRAPTAEMVEHDAPTESHQTSWKILGQRAIAWTQDMLGIGRCGTLILGEDSDSLEELEMAASDYNRLRDLFRHQPSMDEQQDICNFKYLDLSRRVRFDRAQRAFEKSPKDGSDHARYVWECLVRGFDWTIRRNALGYLIEWQRIMASGALVMFLFAFVYWLGGANAFEDVSATAAESNGGSSGMSFGNAMYFSVVTFTSLGYGDIHPLGFFKVLAAGEALIGVALISLFIVAWARKMVQ